MRLGHDSLSLPLDPPLLVAACCRYKIVMAGKDDIQMKRLLTGTRKTAVQIPVRQRATFKTAILV